MDPYVRNTFIEEIKKIEEYTGKDYSDLYDHPVKEFSETSYLGVQENTPARVLVTAINNTVKRVHQAMESFIHNCNTIHSRGGEMIASLCSNA